jgi:uncharacterized membrane protein
MGEIHVKESIIISRKACDIYRFWRKFENLPHFIDHLSSVEDLGGGRHRWTVKTPVGPISWESEIIEDEADVFIQWRSLPGSGVRNNGSLKLAEQAAGVATEATVELHYQPPPGFDSFFVDAILEVITDGQIKAGLAKLKTIMESQTT